MDRLTLVLENLKALGGRKLAALGLIFALVVAIVAVAAYLLSRPTFEVLYAGLDREDVSRIGAALKSSGIAFDVNPEGNTVSVPYGQTAQARMLLAERGLPQSANAGYELFDKVGALGLTSFMQEVTRVRALEGELARTIQLIRGVKAARVHIVMPDEGSFRLWRARLEGGPDPGGRRTADAGDRATRLLRRRTEKGARRHAEGHGRRFHVRGT
jgi:flagellar M-ring protein FliF